MRDLDKVCKLSEKQIYDCLTNDVTTYALLKAKLISKYASNNPTLQQKINNAFSDHGF